MSRIICKGEKAWFFVLEALDIKTDIPINKIGAIYKGRIYEKGLLGIIQLYEDMQKYKDH
jgi:hypothetical protein